MVTSELTAHYIVPIAGSIIAIFLAISPLKKVVEAQKNNNLGLFNPLPTTFF